MGTNPERSSMAKEPKVLFTEHTRTDKKFSYAYGDVSLIFTLNVDNSSELRRYVKCLEKALEDVKATIATMKN